MPVLDINYICSKCEHKSPPDELGMICACGGRLRPDSIPGITGTRDSFGIRREFRDDATGETIDNWKTWEKKGYRNPVEVTKNHQVKEKIKEKVKRVKNQ